MLLELLSSGMTMDEILGDYEDLLAVLAFAALLLHALPSDTAGAAKACHPTTRFPASKYSFLWNLISTPASDKKMPPPLAKVEKIKKSGNYVAVAAWNS
jgi:hypothetical protein